MSGERRE